MIQCPGCGRTLPNGAVRCQFCGADLSNVARPRAAAPARKVKGPPTYIMTLYHVGAGWWILQGGRTVAVSLGILPEMMSALGGAFAGFVIVAIVIGAIQALLGIGLMAKVELARGIVNVLCWINILLGLYSFIFLFGMVLVSRLRASSASF